MNLRRAFSMLEVMVATTLSIVVIAAATTAIIVIIRSLNQTGQSSSADTEAQLVSEYLVAQLQSVGGGAVRPWMAVVIENNSGVENSDVIRFADVPAELPSSLSITEKLPEAGRFSFIIVERRDGRGTCGLARLTHDDNGDGFPDDGGRRFTRAELAGRQAVLTSPTGETWRSVVIQDVGIGDRAESCFVQFAASGSGLASNGALRDADRHTGLDLDGDGVPGPESPDEWVLGQLSLVRVREWRFERLPDDRQGQVVERVATGATFGPPRVLLQGARDLQVSPGYDYRPFDGQIVETRSGNNDEWVNSVDGDDGGVVRRIPLDLTAPAVDVPQDGLRMLDIAVIISPPKSERQGEIRAFDGPLRRTNEPRLAGGRAFLRNQLLFL
jgi:hypothetical protein